MLNLNSIEIGRVYVTAHGHPVRCLDASVLQSGETASVTIGYPIGVLAIIKQNEYLRQASIAEERDYWRALAMGITGEGL